VGLASLSFGSCRTGSRAPVTRDQLAGIISRSSQQDVLALSARAAESGASAEDLLAAAYLALLGTGGDAGDVHAILAIPSIHSLTERARGVARWMPTLWAVVNANLWCRDRVTAAAPPRTEFSRDAFENALRDGDVARAEGGFLALLGSAGVEVAIAELLLEASRPRIDPHAAIYAAQAVRALRFIGRANAELVLCSVVRHLARSAIRGGSTTMRGHLDSASSSSMGLSPPLESGDAAVIDPTLYGDFPADAMIVGALEARTRDGEASGLGVHQTTLLDALLFCVTSSRAPTKSSVVSQSVRWLEAQVREIDTTAEGIYDSNRRALARAEERLEADEPGFLAEHRERLVRNGSGEHDFKYFAALDSIAGQLRPGLRRRWTAAMVLARTSNTTSSWERWEEAVHAIHRITNAAGAP
jgi:hypothetical protein